MKAQRPGGASRLKNQRKSFSRAEALLVRGVGGERCEKGKQWSGPALVSSLWFGIT